jgi:hypothetical protein
VERDGPIASTITILEPKPSLMPISSRCVLCERRSKLGLSLTADSFGGVGTADTAPKVDRGSADEIFRKIRAMQEASMLS